MWYSNLQSARTTRTTIHITCPVGLAHALRDEVIALGLKIESFIPNGVTLFGTITDAMRCCMYLRCAHHVLVQIARFECATPQELYKQATDMPWEEIIRADGYIAITSSVLNDSIRDTRFANLTLKDAIVDRMRERCDKRPDSGPDRSKAVVHLYWKESRCSIYIDFAGEPLCRRGYRTNPFRAPLQESLAAGLIYATNWQGTAPLVNPMCGSGTLAIEGVLMALKRAPGLSRTNYSFMHTRWFDKKTWQDLYDSAARLQIATLPEQIVASDIDPRAIEIARTNAQQAGVADFITWQTSDFSETIIPESRQGIIIVNPEYGERLGDLETLKTTYSNLGNFFKRKCNGYTGYILTSNTTLAGRVGLKSKRKMPFKNGSLDCKLYEYELF